MDFVPHGVNQPLKQNVADEKSKQQPQAKPQNLLDVPKPKSPQSVQGQRSPNPDQSNRISTGNASQQQQIKQPPQGADSSNQTKVQQTGLSNQSQHSFSIGNIGHPHGVIGAAHSSNASIATVVEVGTSQYKSGGGGRFIRNGIHFHCNCYIHI